MLSKPSKQLVKRICTEVGFEDRLKGFRLRERKGMMPVTIYSFKELVTFLADPYPGIDLKHLHTWVDKVMADPELAQKIADVLDVDAGDFEKTARVKDLATYRFLQCERII